MNRPIHTFAGLLTLGLAACGGDRAPGSNLNARALSRNGPSRTVAGAFTTIYRPDDGTSTTLSTPPPFQHRVRALLVPDASATCYSTFPIAPVLGAPTAPLINGTDGFTSQSGVGAQPTISWSPPTLGAPSSYRVNIYVLDTRISPGDVTALNATVYTGTTFTVPPGVLQAGSEYYATIAPIRRIGISSTARRSAPARRLTTRSASPESSLRDLRKSNRVRSPDGPDGARLAKPARTSEIKRPIDC